MESLEEILERYGALLEGHFVLASGRHSEKYLDIEKVNNEVLDNFCREIANQAGTRFHPFSGRKIDIVLGPAKMGNRMAKLVAGHLENIYRSEVDILLTKKDKKGNQILEEVRNIAGKNVLIVDDVLTTGRSVSQVANAVKKLGGNVLAIAIICNRDNAPLGFPALALFELKMAVWLKEECPLCKNGIPINTLKSP